MDFAGRVPLRADMDEDAANLIVQLCTRIGMIMEDASIDALTIRSVPANQQNAVLAKLAIAAERISALVQAARPPQNQR